jgi:hypothetical protein
VLVMLDTLQYPTTPLQKLSPTPRIDFFTCRKGASGLSSRFLQEDRPMLLQKDLCRGTSLIRSAPPVGPYSGPTPGDQ